MSRRLVSRWVCLLLAAGVAGGCRIVERGLEQARQPVMTPPAPSLPQPPAPPPSEEAVPSPAPPVTGPSEPQVVQGPPPAPSEASSLPEPREGAPPTPPTPEAPSPPTLSLEEQRSSLFEVLRWEVQQARAALQPEGRNLVQAETALKVARQSLHHLETLLPERQARMHLEAALAWLAGGQPSKAEPHLLWALHLSSPGESGKALRQALDAVKAQDAPKAQALLNPLLSQAQPSPPEELLTALSRSLEFALDALGRRSVKIAELELEETKALLEQLENLLFPGRVSPPSPTPGGAPPTPPPGTGASLSQRGGA